MVCQECGNNNPDTNNFCGNCGRRLFPQNVPETVGARQSRVRSTGDALSRLGVADYDYVDVSEHPPAHTPVRENTAEPAAKEVAPDPLPVRPSPISFPSPEPVNRAAEPVRVEPDPVPPVEERPTRTTISGPSFLGLTDSTPSDDSEYLLQDEPTSHAGRWIFLLLVIIAILAISGWIERDNIRSGKIHIPYLTNLLARTMPDNSPAANQKAVDQADNSDEKLMTNDPTLKDQNLDSKPADNTTPAPPPTTNAPTTSGTTAGTTPSNPAASTPPDTPPVEPETTATPGGTDNAGAAPADSGDAHSSTPPPTPATPDKTKPSARSAKIEGGPDPSQNENLLLGEKYLYGRGVPQNCNQALTNLRTAADQNNAPAMSHLAAMYASGNCVTLNRVTAYKWFAKAQNADPGNQWRERNMNMLWRDMTPQERASVNR